MKAVIPPEIETLSSMAEELSALETPGDLMRYQSVFRDTYAFLQNEADRSRRVRWLEHIERIVPKEGLARVLFQSFLVAASQDARHLRELYETMAGPEFTTEQRHFFYWQLITRHARIADEAKVDPAAVYSSLLRSCRKLLKVSSPWIEVRDRNPDIIVVITNQLLGLRHAPTADCLDYCHVLQHRLKKRVFLINTGDMPWTLPVPYYDPVTFAHVEEYAAGGKLPFRGEVFDFYQCRKPMPDPEEIGLILGSILKLRPMFILSLGHSNVTPDLCSEFLTVATMPFGTDLPRAASNLFVLPRKRRAEDAGFMRQWHISEEQIIETQYTFRLPERTAALTRADLRLPATAYVIAVVGNRLDEEIDNRFAEELSDFLSGVPQAFIAFMGQFGLYHELARRFEVLGRRSAFLGSLKDISAAYECCDAYWNPPRYGGGTSAAFALAAGLPVFTRAGGDVANIVGPRFLFSSVGAIRAHVERSLAEPEHRSSWAAMARTRFSEISDRDGMIAGILSSVCEKANVRSSRPGIEQE